MYILIFLPNIPSPVIILPHENDAHFVTATDGDPARIIPPHYDVPFRITTSSILALSHASLVEYLDTIPLSSHDDVPLSAIISSPLLVINISPEDDTSSSIVTDDKGYNIIVRKAHMTMLTTD